MHFQLHQKIVFAKRWKQPRWRSSGIELQPEYWNDLTPLELKWRRKKFSVTKVCQKRFFLTHICKLVREERAIWGEITRWFHSGVEFMVESGGGIRWFGNSMIWTMKHFFLVFLLRKNVSCKTNECNNGDQSSSSGFDSLPLCLCCTSVSVPFKFFLLSLSETMKEKMEKPHRRRLWESISLILPPTHKCVRDYTLICSSSYTSPAFPTFQSSFLPLSLPFSASLPLFPKHSFSSQS